jgi:hypothetical protein
MATATLRPSILDKDQWPGGTKPDNVNDASDATAVGNGDTAGDMEDGYYIDLLPGSAGPIISVELFTRAVKGTGQNGIFSAGLQVGAGTKTLSNDHDITQGAGIQQKSKVWALDPDSNAWTAASINDLRVYFKQTSGTGGKNMACYDIWLNVVFIEVGGGINFMVA